MRLQQYRDNINQNIKTRKQHSGSKEMINKEPANIRMIVEDEEALYSTFSPDAEFKHPVKSYIRSKVDAEHGLRNNNDHGAQGLFRSGP